MVDKVNGQVKFFPIKYVPTMRQKLIFRKLEFEMIIEKRAFLANYLEYSAKWLYQRQLFYQKMREKIKLVQ